MGNYYYSRDKKYNVLCLIPLFYNSCVIHYGSLLILIPYSFLLIFRELAYQISEQFHVLGKHINLITEVIVGGVGKAIV
jgi:hypothetical protein